MTATFNLGDNTVNVTILVVNDRKVEEVEVFNITLSILSSTSGMRIQLGDIRNAVGIIHDSSKTIIRVMCFL